MAASASRVKLIVAAASDRGNTVVDGEGSIFCFVNYYAAVLTLTPPVVNQLGGTPVLISGLCVQPGDTIICEFDGRFIGLAAEIIDDSTFMCVTPLMTTLGEVEFELTKFLPQPPDIRITANFITSMLTLWWWWWW